MLGTRDSGLGTRDWDGQVRNVSGKHQRRCILQEAPVPKGSDRTVRPPPAQESKTPSRSMFWRAPSSKWAILDEVRTFATAHERWEDGVLERFQGVVEGEQHP